MYMYMYTCYMYCTVIPAFAHNIVILHRTSVRNAFFTTYWLTSASHRPGGNSLRHGGEALGHYHILLLHSIPYFLQQEYQIHTLDIFTLHLYIYKLYKCTHKIYYHTTTSSTVLQTVKIHNRVHRHRIHDIYLI
jgi:hypothetical protein